MQISRCSSSEGSEISERSEVSAELSERAANCCERAAKCSAGIGYLGCAISMFSFSMSFIAMGKKCKNFDMISVFYLAGVSSEVLGISFLIHSYVLSYIEFANVKEIPKKKFLAVMDAANKVGDSDPRAGRLLYIPLCIAVDLVFTIAVPLVGLYAAGCNEVLADRLSG